MEHTFRSGGFNRCYSYRLITLPGKHSLIQSLGWILSWTVKRGEDR